MTSALTGNALSLAANGIATSLKGQALGAKQLGKAAAPGTKQEVILFADNLVSGVAVGSVVTLNSEQGSLVQAPTDFCLAISGEGGVVVQDASGGIGVSRTVFSQGLNADGLYVIGDSSQGTAPKVLGWRVDETGARIEANTTNPLLNANDLTQLVPVNIGKYKTFSEQTTTVTLNNILNSGQPADTTGAGTYDDTQTLTVYDMLGNRNSLSITWRKILDPSVETATHETTEEATSVAIIDAAGVTHDNCDVWQMQITCNGDPVHIGGTTNPFDATNSPRIYMKNGSIVAFANAGDNQSIGTSFPTLTVPLNNVAANALSLDLGLTVGSLGRSRVVEGATLAQLNGMANGSALVELQGWSVDDDGVVSVLYPTKNLPVYQLPVGTFASVDNVLITNGLWYADSASGPLTLNQAGIGAGGINAGKIELSTVDPTNILLDAIPRSQVTAAASKLVSTAIKDQQAVINAV